MIIYLVLLFRQGRARVLRTVRTTVVRRKLVEAMYKGTLAARLLLRLDSVRSRFSGQPWSGFLQYLYGVVPSLDLIVV